MIENKEIKNKKIISCFDFIANKIIEICYCQYRFKNSKAKSNLDIKSNYQKHFNKIFQVPTNHSMQDQKKNNKKADITKRKEKKKNNRVNQWQD